MWLQRSTALTATIATLAASGFVLSGCATAPGQETKQPGLLDRSLAVVHSDIAFMLVNGPRPVTPADTPRDAPPGAPCPAASCPPVAGFGAQMPDDSPAAFSLQVQRISTQLQEGALSQFPDLASRIPGFAANGFDVYVTTGRQQGSTSSASGRIALNAALGRLQPYDDWLAFVIAREMGHVIARHHEENSVASMATSVMMNLLIPGSSLLKSAASTVGSGIAAGSKRETQAEEADVIAFVLLEAAGFRLRDVSLSLLVAAPALDDGAWSADFRKSSETLMTGIRAGKRIPLSEAATLAPAASTTPKLLSASTGAAPFR